MQITVIGAGIAGLTFALSAHRLGFDVRVHEAVEELRPLGLGINLQPNAARELDELGLGAELARLGVPTAELAYFSKHGQKIWSEPRGLAAGYGWPQYSVHRGRLQDLLLSTARARLGADAIRTGEALQDFEQTADRVIARVGKTATHFVECDVLVGADGLHSSVRRVLHSAEPAPVYGRWLMYRGALEAAPFLSGRTMISAGTLDQRFVCYPMAPQTDARAGVLLNWVASLPILPEEMHLREQWNQRIDRRRLIQDFKSWRFPWLDVAALIERTQDVYAFPFVDREPLPSWGHGRVTLIGDAAHPMYPIGSQAGSQAIIDARALAAALAAFADPSKALQNYESLRRPQMNELASRNRGLGAEAILQIVDSRAPLGFSQLSDVISDEELQATAHAYKALAGIDAASVNSRPPWFGVA